MMATVIAGGAVTFPLSTERRAELDELARQVHRDQLIAEAVSACLDVHRGQSELIRDRATGPDSDHATDEEVEAAYAAFR